MRQESHRYKRLGKKWRLPRGKHSKMRTQLMYRTPIVDSGYRGPEAVRGLHPSGFEDVLIYNLKGLEGINPDNQAVRIASSVGVRKRKLIEEKAKELGVRVLNPLNVKKVNEDESGSTEKNGGESA